MRIMVGYDGSESAASAVDDLRRAGLPQTGSILIVTAAGLPETLIRTVPQPLSIRDLVTEKIFANAITYARARRSQLHSAAREVAREGYTRAVRALPGWYFETKVGSGAAAEVLLSTADRVRPDLLVVGTRGRSSLGRLLFGSVSHTVGERSGHPFRVGRLMRGNTQEPPRIVAGSVTIRGLELLIRSLRRRVWPAGTTIDLTMFDDGVTTGRLSHVYPYSRSILDQCAETLRHSGVSVVASVMPGDITSNLLERARHHHADSIAIAGDVGVGAGTSLIREAACSVEFVREPVPLR